MTQDQQAPQDQQNPTRRFGADGEETDAPAAPTDEVVVAEVPGDDPASFVEITLSHPLNERDRIYLGLPADASTEVGQKIKVNKNGAKAVINAGYAMVDPEDADKVRAVLRGESADGQSGDSGEPTGMRTAEAAASPMANPPQAQSTPATPGPSGTQPGQEPGATDGAQPSAEGAQAAKAPGAKAAGADKPAKP